MGGFSGPGGVAAAHWPRVVGLAAAGNRQLFKLICCLLFMLLLLSELYLSILSRCKLIFVGSVAYINQTGLFRRLQLCGYHFVHTVGGVAVVVDGGATLTNALVVSYLLSVVYFLILYRISMDN